MTNAKKALGIPLDRHAEQTRIHVLKLADVVVRQVGDHGEFGVEQLRQPLPTEIAQDRKGVVDPVEILKKNNTELRSLKVTSFIFSFWPRNGDGGTTMDRRSTPAAFPTEFYYHIKAVHLGESTRDF